MIENRDIDLFVNFCKKFAYHTLAQHGTKNNKKSRKSKKNEFALLFSIILCVYCIFCVNLVARVVIKPEFDLVGSIQFNCFGALSLSLHGVMFGNGCRPNLDILKRANFFPKRYNFFIIKVKSIGHSKYQSKKFFPSSFKHY